MNRPLALLILVAFSLPALALAADTDPKRRITPVDQRKAASIVLKRSDFAPGWKKVPTTAAGGEGEGESCPGYRPDQSDLVLTGEAEAEFEAAEGMPSVSSTSNVYRTRRDALAAWSRTNKPSLAPCLARLYKEEFQRQGNRAVIAKASRIAFPKVAPRTAAYRVTLQLTVSDGGKSVTVPFTIVLVALGNGRGDCVLTSASFGDEVPAANLRLFAKVTASRLADAKL